MSYSMTKLQYSLTAKNIAVNSCDLSDSPEKATPMTKNEKDI